MRKGSRRGPGVQERGTQVCSSGPCPVWGGLGALGLLDHCLNVSHNCSYHAGIREDVMARGGLFRDKLVREGIGLDLLGSGVVRDGEVEVTKE